MPNKMRKQRYPLDPLKRVRYLNSWRLRERAFAEPALRIGIILELDSSKKPSRLSLFHGAGGGYNSGGDGGDILKVVFRDSKREDFGSWRQWVRRDLYDLVDSASHERIGEMVVNCYYSNMGAFTDSSVDYISLHGEKVWPLAPVPANAQ